MQVLAIDVGGTHVKILASGQDAHGASSTRGPRCRPRRMVPQVQQLAADWQYDSIAIGYPGPVLRGKPISEPYNLAPGWVGFDFAAAFQRPVKVINDAAMQALGSYEAGQDAISGSGHRPGFGAGRRRHCRADGAGRICRTARAPSKIMSDFAGWKNTARRSGGAMLRRGRTPRRRDRA